jgi:hypothetical protein
MAVEGEGAGVASWVRLKLQEGQRLRQSGKCFGEGHKQERDLMRKGEEGEEGLFHRCMWARVSAA